MVVRLAESPVAAQIIVNQEHCQQFFQMAQQVGSFETIGDRYCQIFNPMWKRLGLMNFIQSIYPRINDAYNNNALLPPNTRRPAGRPKKRILHEVEMELQRTLKCRRCRGSGHNRALVQNPI